MNETILLGVALALTLVLMFVLTEPLRRRRGRRMEKALTRSLSSADHRRGSPLPQEGVKAVLNPFRGSVEEAPVADVLAALASYRSSGTLRIDDGSRQYAVYLLFGRPYHAVGPDMHGEAVLRRVLLLRKGNYAFDAKSRLPQESSIDGDIPAPLSRVR
jgi:hypothetical protein